ncbi:hypothetical protein EHW65_20770 [Erwinia psidii]|uniref:hypothetical protein n=1 Tax=Erwinia psidii TaxID=69224 RepID=UPI00226B72B5|nr:hypothetical protein [Erwinia psidii]MCX8959578.1 hypothetical protein [Erwinia psidii]
MKREAITALNVPTPASIVAGSQSEGKNSQVITTRCNGVPVSGCLFDSKNICTVRALTTAPPLLRVSSNNNPVITEKGVGSG